MVRAASARRYAQAVFQIALERDEMDLWQEDIAVLASALENAELSSLLDAPQIPAHNKVATIKQVLGDSVGRLPANLLSLLASRNTAHLVTGILEEYATLLDAHRGIARAEVLSAVPLEPDQQAKVAELLGKILGKDVRVTSHVEPDIIGGIIARVSYRVIDGSVRTKLSEMRRTIVEQRS